MRYQPFPPLGSRPEPPVASVETIPEAPPVPEAPRFDVILGATRRTPQYGALGRSMKDRVALDLNGCDTVALFGVQGYGKSYTLGVVAEMAVAEAPGINTLSVPLGAVIFHYHKSETYEPEFVAAVGPNDVAGEVQRLRSEYGATPRGIGDVLVLVPEATLELRRQQYPELAVEPLKFSSAEIGPEGWKFLLGAAKNQSLYVRQMVGIMRQCRDRLTVDTLKRAVVASGISQESQQLALSRIELAEPFIDDSRRLGSVMRPGRTVIVDLRDEWIERSEALGIFVVLLRLFGSVKHEGEDFNKLFVFDEAHKYISEPDLVSGVVENIREMRHNKNTVLIASQDPLSVPRAVLELCSVLVLHRITSPAWLKHLQSAIAALKTVQIRTLATLSPGEALVWAQRSNVKAYTIEAQRLTVRPRFTRHGGGTKVAVKP